MFRITPLSPARGCETLKLEGKLAGAAVPEIRHVVGSCLERSPRVGLDLSGVTFADAEGVVCLRELVGRGAEILAASGLLRELLRNGRS